MGWLAVAGVALGVAAAWAVLRYAARKRGGQRPTLGELMFPVHHTDRRQDDQRKGNR